MGRRLVSVVLVDEHGWLLLQERAEGAGIGVWSLVTGDVGAGETDAQAADRELARVLPTKTSEVELTLVDIYEVVDAGRHEVSLLLALTDLTDADLGSDRGAAFVDPRAVDRLRWGRDLVHALPRVMSHPAYVERFGLREPRDFGCVLLVDARGRLLLQERDEHAPIDPDRWGLPGGHLDPGEDPERGARRELEEETGVRLPPGALEHVETHAVFHPAYGSVDRVHVYAARADLGDDDIDCREGRQIVFVEPDRARHLDLTMTGVLAVPAFLESDTYRRLTR